MPVPWILWAMSTCEGREIDASFQICFGPSFLDLFDCRDVPRCERFFGEGRLLHVHAVNVCRILENYPWTQFKGWFSWKQLIIHWFNWFVNPTSCTLPRRMFLKSHCCQRSTLLDLCEENWKSWGWSPYFGLYACWVSLSMYLQCSSRLLGSKSFR